MRNQFQDRARAREETPPSLHVLVLGAADRLVPVLEQIVANGKNRRESIMQLAMMRRVNKRSSERFYDRGVKALLTFFSPNEIKGETHVEKSSCL